MKIYWHAVFSIVYLCFLASLFFTPTATAAPTDFVQAVGKNLIYRGDTVLLQGTNFDNVPALGASIGSGNMASIQITEADYTQLKADGGNHVRFGLSFNWYQNDPTAFFQMVDQHIAWAREHNLWLVLNMFTTPGNCYEGYSTSCGIWNSPSEQQELKEFWIDVAEHYYAEPVIAGYDLLNEPNPQGPNYCSTWFNLASEIRYAMYAIAPNQLVFIEACSDPGNSFRYRSPPFGTNIVYEAHDYTPIELSTNSSSTYPGTATDWFGTCTYNKNAFLGIQQIGDQAGCGDHSNLSLVYGLDWATTNNVPMYIGEWGATSSLNGYVTFHQDKAEIYNTLGVSSAHYTWKHRTIITGGSDQWGIYANPLRLDEPLKLAAVQTSWANAVFPNFALSTPTISFTPLSPNPLGSVSPSWSGTAFGGSDTLSTVQYQLDGTSGSWTSCAAVDGNIDEITETFTCSLSNLSQGSHTIYMRASNTAAMVSTSESEAFVIDTIGPVISVTPLAQDPTYDTTPSFSGSTTDDHGTVSMVQYQIGDTFGSWSSCVADDGTFDEASETFSCTVSPALNPGDQEIYFRSRDQLGTYSTTLATQSFTLSNDREWVQTDWSGGSGQTSWSDETKFFSSSQISHATSGEISLSSTTTTPWYNSSWNYRKSIMIDHNSVSGGSNLTNFPVLINLSSESDLAARAMSNGYDLVFTSSDGTTKLSHEIDKFTSATGELQAWVKIPTLSASSDTQLYLYYGNGAASNQSNASDVWTGNGYAGVWHLSQSPGSSAPQFTDSLGVNHGTATVLVAADQIACKIDGGVDFASSNDWISMPNGSALRPTGAMTTSAWIKINSYSGSGRIFSKQGGTTARAWNFGLESTDNSISFGVASNSSTMISASSTAHPSTGTWVYAVGVYEPSTALRVYVDGSESGTNTTSIPASQFSNNGFGPRIGMSVNNVGDFNGQIDEVRLSTVARSSGWIATEYANQNTPSSFYSVGSQQVRVTYNSPGTLVSSIFDTQGASNWDSLTYTLSAPTNTSSTLKVRSSQSSSMSGASDFSDCPTITSGTDISNTACVTDGDRYVQYQVNLSSSDTLVTPSLSYFQLVYARVNEVPQLSVTTPPSSLTSPLSLQGTATDSDGLITNVEYQADSSTGSWSSCVADDQTFNESSENFTCTLTLSSGTHTVYLRSTDNQNANSEISTVTVSVTQTQNSDSSSTSGGSTSIVSASSCSATPPGAKAPWLYAGISESPTIVLLYLTPADLPWDHYVLRFGTSPGNYIFGSDSLTGVDRVLTITHLQPNTKYYFSLRAGNQCAVGPWSNEIQVQTSSSFLSSLSKVTTSLQPDSDIPPKVLVTEEEPRLEIDSDTDSTASATATESGIENLLETNRHQITINVKDILNRPVQGATVIMHSDPKEGITNENGEVVFQDVESGQHRLIIEHQGATAEQSIYVDGSVPNLSLTIKLEPVNRIREYTMAVIIVILGISLAGILLSKRKTDALFGPQIRLAP